MSRILLVDKCSIYRLGLRCLIETNIPEAKVLEGSSLLNALSKIRAEGYIDLVLAELNLSRLRSLAPLNSAREASPATRWAVFSTADTRVDILATLNAGFHGFVSKHQSDDDILSAVKDLLSGRIYVPQLLPDGVNSACLDSSPNWDAPPMSDFLKLTARQRQTLLLIVQGLSNKEIARQLRIAEATTKIHVAALMRVLRVRNRTEAAFKAANLVDDSGAPRFTSDFERRCEPARRDVSVC
jgi:DNA-binding NarL/FixJ family response regulator